MTRWLVAAMLLASCSNAAGPDDGPAIDDTGATPDAAIDAAIDVPDAPGSETVADAPAPGSLEACALQYRGFDTCCTFADRANAWIFVDAACTGARQCIDDVDCPAGYVETRQVTGDCECLPARPGTCDGDDAVTQVTAGQSCPTGRHRCPVRWPDDGWATCSNCECEAMRGYHLDLRGTRSCPPGQEISGCPCEGGGYCCLGVGQGLLCGTGGTWEFFWDCPCAPDWGCTDPLPGLCNPAY